MGNTGRDIRSPASELKLAGACVREWGYEPRLLNTVSKGWGFIHVGVIVQSCTFTEYLLNTKLSNFAIQSISAKLGSKIFMSGNLHCNFNSNDLVPCSLNDSSHLSSCLQRESWNNWGRRTGRPCLSLLQYSFLHLSCIQSFSLNISCNIPGTTLTPFLCKFCS